MDINKKLEDQDKEYLALTVLMTDPVYVTGMHFEELVTLVGVDKAMRYYEIREETGINSFVDEHGLTADDIDYCNLVIQKLPPFDLEGGL